MKNTSAKWWVTGALLGLLCAWMFQRTPHPRAQEPVPAAPIVADSGRIEAAHESASESRSEPVAIPLPIISGEALRKARTVAKETNMSLTRSDSFGLKLNDAFVALLELTPEQAHELNASLGKLLDRLRTEELANAYVIAGDGREEIVVPAFDRTEVLENFRTELATQLGAGVAEMVAERLPYDSYLAVGNSEIRAYIERGSDGADRDVFQRRVQSKPYELPGPDPARRGPRITGVTHRTAGLLRDEHNFRTKHLWSAIDRLPKRDGTPTAPMKEIPIRK